MTGTAADPRREVGAATSVEERAKPQVRAGLPAFKPPPPVAAESELGAPAAPSSMIRFWSNVDKTGSCWLWTGLLNGAGYGQFYTNGKNWFAHRLSYVIECGEISPDLELDHLCRVRRCIRPDHLEAVTHSENMLRSPVTQRRTHCYQGHSLTGENVLEFRGKRRCRICRNASKRANYAAHHQVTSPTGESGRDAN